MYRMGFACKYMHHDRTLKPKEIKAIEGSYNTRITTITALRKLNKEQVYQKIYDIVSHNMKSQMKLLNYVNSLPPELKMMRLSSDLLPAYTHPEYNYVYKDMDMINLLSKGFGDLGHFARTNNIRLSMHPNQFCVLASENPLTVENSIREFEYHADMIRYMGYGLTFQDFKCNVHISGRLGVDKMIESINRLSETAKNTITIENEEKVYGLNDCLKLAPYCPIVLDIHHFWINSEYYIELNDPRIELIQESWRGVKPTMHYSQSREELLNLGYSENEKLDIKQMLLDGKVNKKDLCAHSDRMWNIPCNLYAKSFLDYFDIMFEVKHKNLAVIEYYEKYIKKPS